MPSRFRVTRLSSPAELLHRAGDVLSRREAENNLILGLCGEAAAANAPPPYLWIVEEKGGVIGAAYMAPGRNLVLPELPAEALDALIGQLTAENRLVPGVSAPWATANAFAAAWSQATGRPATLHMDQRIYACRRVISPQPPGGALRLAEERDRSLLTDWTHEFHLAVKVTQDRAELDGLVAHRIARQSLLIWDAAGPVSCAAFSRETAGGAAINYVYTPPELRGRGYASACVAALTQRLLDAGKSFCCLYTDLSNPTSNRIYQAIGYEPVCDARFWLFQ